MLSSRKVLLLCAVSVVSSVALSGCSTIPYAREVKKRPSEGGVIALRATHSPEDRAKAETLMRSNCSAGSLKILEEGEVAVGTKTTSDARTSQDQGNTGFSIGALTFGSDPSSRTSGSSETTQLTEWQISYECVASAPAPSSQPPVSAIKKVSSKSNIKK